jgi:D-amino peptidase
VTYRDRYSRRRFLSYTGLATTLAKAAPQAAKERRGLKIFILWDMDGANGIFTREQAWYWEPGVREHVAMEARQIFTSQVNALSAASLAAGATELIVCDTHHGGGNLLQDKLLSDPRITYLYRSVGMQDGKRRWMPGLDETVHGLMLPGHHAKTGTPDAFLPHTWTLQWKDFWINGLSVGEIGIETCFAGHWDIPLIFVQGDEAACLETRQQFPGVVTASVKRAAGFEQAAGLDAESAHRETARGAREAIELLRAGKMRPFKPTLPMTVRVQMATIEAAAKAAERPNVRRVDDHIIECRVGRQADIVKWLLGTGLDMA